MKSGHRHGRGGLITEPVRPAGPAPRVGVGCLVVHAGRVLMVRNHAGRWSTPGGHLDVGESPATAAARETAEETGVAVRDVEFLAVTNDVMDDRAGHYVTIWLRAGTDDPTIRIGDATEIREAGWFDPGHLPEPRHLFFDNLLAGRTLPPLRASALGRPTLVGMIAGGLGRLFNLERGFLHTAIRLTAAPGRTVREYLDGRTTPYVHPVGYLLVSFALFVVLATWLAFFTGGGGNGAFTGVTVALFVAGASRLLFWRSGLNYAEHLILAMYLLGHIALAWSVLLVPMSIAFALGGQRPVLPLMLASLAGGIGYFVWGYSRFFHRRPALGAAGGLAVLLAGCALWLTALVLGLNALRATGIIAT